MNALIDQLTTLRLYGMAQEAQDLLTSRQSLSFPSALKRLVEAELTERQVRSIAYQQRVAKFPLHKDFATFDYPLSTLTPALLEPFNTGEFTSKAHNIIFVGGTGTGKTH